MANEKITVDTDGKRGFRPDRETVWRAFAQEIGAVYHPGDFWEAECIEATVGGFGIVLDLSFREIAGGQVAGTRLRARYRSPDGLRLVIEDDRVFPEPDRKAVENPLVPVPVNDVACAGFRVLAGQSDTAAERLKDADLLWSCLRREPHLRLESLPDSEKQFLLTCFVVEPMSRADRLFDLLEIVSETLALLGATPVS